MAKPREFPQEGDLVVGTVKNVQNFGAFVTLEEYPGKEGFIHIAEVSSGWVKRIRDHVRERSRVVCKVLGVDHRKGHVDLSLKRVNEHQRREKIQEWKNEQKAEKIFEILAERLERPLEKCYEGFGFKLMEHYGSLYAAFEEAGFDVDNLKQEGFEGDWVDVFAEVAAENIQIPYVDIAGFLDVEAYGPDGVEAVRAALAEAEEGEFEDVDIEVQYVGAPHYRVKVRAPDYKIAEEEMRKAADRAIASIEKAHGKAEFQREKEER